MFQKIGELPHDGIISAAYRSDLGFNLIVLSDVGEVGKLIEVRAYLPDFMDQRCDAVLDRVDTHLASADCPLR